jgi:hypothetical protein
MDYDLIALELACAPYNPEYQLLELDALGDDVLERSRRLLARSEELLVDVKRTLAQYELPLEPRKSL